MSIRIEFEECQPPTWAMGAHAQTIFAHFLPSEPIRGTSPQRQKIPLADGDTLVASVYPGSSSFVVILFHGLSGSAQSGYILRTVALALAQNHTVVAVNLRGCGDGKGLAKHPPHSGRGEDLSQSIEWARTRFPHKKIIAAGFSMGANALLTLLTGLRGVHLPDFAIVVNAPTDLASAMQRLPIGLNRIYDFTFVQSCRREIYFMRDQQLIDFSSKISRFANLHHIERVFTAPFSGFDSPEDYHRQCSTFDHFTKIKTPTVIIMSKDDPFLSWEPYLKAQNCPSIDLHLENHGGHMGYLARGPTRTSYRRWLDDALSTIISRAPSFIS